MFGRLWTLGMFGRMDGTKKSRTDVGGADVGGFGTDIAYPHSPAYLSFSLAGYLYRSDNFFNIENTGFWYPEKISCIIKADPIRERAKKMEFSAEVIAILIGFVGLVNGFVAGFITPLFDKYNWEKFWLMYVAWVLAGVLVWLAEINLFENYIANPLIGQILTAIVAGRGANLIHDVADSE